MSIFEYNEEEEKKKLRKAEYEAGISAGREKERLSLAKMMLEENEPMDKIVKYTGYEIDKIRKIAEQVNR